MKKFFVFIGGLIAAIAGIISIYQAVKPSGPPSFSGRIFNYADAASFTSFLSQHDTQRVNLNVNVTCDQTPACKATSGPGSSGIELILFSSPAAVNCWNGNGGNTCSGGALITFVIPAGASGTLSGSGAGYYSIQGNWIVRNQGSGGNTPAGDPNYELDAAS